MKKHFFIVFSCLSLIVFTNVRAGDYEQIIELVLNAPNLQHFLHPEVEGRTPLILSSEKIPESISIEKFGMPVHILPKETIVESKLLAFLEFSELRVGTEEADVTLLYAIEGVRMNAQFVKAGGKWVIRDSDLAER